MTERNQSGRPVQRKKWLSAALRENLKRRKAQARGRAAASAAAGNADKDNALR